MSNPTYPKRTPDPASLPPDVDEAPDAGLIDYGNYAQQGEIAPVPPPDMRTPVDVRPEAPGR